MMMRFLIWVTTGEGGALVLGISVVAMSMKHRRAPEFSSLQQCHFTQHVLIMAHLFLFLGE